jgi:tryptophan halogenase
MVATEVKRIVVVGNGIAGPVVATALAISLRGSDTKIALIRSGGDNSESDVQVFRGGAGAFHQVLGIDEARLKDRTNGVIGLGTRYRGFGADGRDVFVPLGSHGRTLRLVDFHHYFLKLRAEGGDENYNAYSLPATAAASGRFTPQTAVENPAQGTVAYDVCVDRDRYARHILELAAELGVSVIEADVGAVDLDSEGCIDSVALTDGNRVDGDFFIDCSGSRLLIDHMDTAQEFLDWSSWLPCDRIATLRTEGVAQPELFATVEANDFGWMQRTMVKDSAAMAFAYCSQYADDDLVRGIVAGHVGGAGGGELRVKERRAGSLARHWIRNCLAIGPAAVTLESIEVSTLHVVQSSTLRLLGMLPRRKISVMLAEEYNRVMLDELTHARDYQVLRYALAGRRKGPFWENHAQVKLPDSLQGRIDLFRSFGRFTRGDHRMLSQANWFSSFLNFGFWPSSYDPMADMIDEQRMTTELGRFRNEVQEAAGQRQ